MHNPRRHRHAQRELFKPDCQHVRLAYDGHNFTIHQSWLLGSLTLFLRQEMTAQDLQMIVHGVSRAETSLDAFRVQDVKSLAQLVLEART